MYSIFAIVVLVSIVLLHQYLAEGAIADHPKDYLLCASYNGIVPHFSQDKPEEVPSGTETPYQKCPLKTYCYALWTEDPVNETVNIVSQGCWDLSTDGSGKPNECDRLECLADRKPPKAANNTKFCCCSQNMCNVNFTDAYKPSDDIPPPSTEIAKKIPIKPILIWLPAFILLVILIGLSVLLYYYWIRKSKKNDLESGGHYYQHNSMPSPPDYSLDKLKLLNIIGQGRYGCVWRGIIEDEEVAVKVFAAHHRNYFLNEYEMYKISGENSALLKCFGGGEHGGPMSQGGGPTDYLLILSLEQECLQEYLKNHTLDLSNLSKMSLGIAKGLAHLHSDLGGKLCIAHRDINTRNILVRADLSCCICDLGLAVVPKKTENKSISEAGTLRYMAPEVLEGAVNLRDCESALKQIDVYALGLVLWELGIRCTDMQNSTEPTIYLPPFYKEAGENPTLEQMQTLVSRRKARPLWPASWKQDSPAARLLCETAEDCWDQDAEARLTSLCVVERLLELPLLKGGRLMHPNSNTIIHHHHHHLPPLVSSPTPLINNNHLHDNEISVGTIETLLSPSEPPQPHCKNSNQFAACITPLQPFQGRNPCLERNLLSGSSDSLLIDKSSKHCTNSESQNLITNDFLNFQINHRAMPIPYLQNAVHGSPKQYNNNTNANTNQKQKKWNLMRFFNQAKKPFQLNSSNSSKETQVKLINNSNNQVIVTTTSLLNERPSTLPLTNVKHPENSSGINQIIKRQNQNNSLREEGGGGGQCSVEHFNEIFSSATDLSRLKDPSIRVKTPGDVPPSVRRTRGKAAKDSARFSLYDDRMMSPRTQWGSAPDLEPPPQPPPSQLCDLQDRDSVSSF